jgi:hypothetical protein
MLKWLRPKRTPDEELVRQIKESVSKLKTLGKEASSRGIIVWLKTREHRGEFFILEKMMFDEAYKSTRTNLG